MAKKTAVKKTSAKSRVVKSRGKTAVKSKTVVKAKPARAASKKAVKTGSSQTTYKSTSIAGSARVIEYKLFTEDSVRSLEDQVNYLIKKGWAPVGGVVLQGQSTFTQTMVRHEN